MKFYDCHTHLNYDPLLKNADHIANICRQNNIILNNVGTNLKSSQLAIDLARKHENVFAIIGVHPNDVNQDSIEKIIKQLEIWLSNKSNKIVAIGETGLDYHYEGYDKQKQHQYLLEHLNLAKKYSLPLMIHVRDAHMDMIHFLKQHKTNNLPVIIHCYTDNVEIVKQYVALDCYISIPGVITFKNARELKQAIHFVPLNRLLSETDAPWLAPAPHRGQQNTPQYIPLVVKEMANELNIEYEKFANIIFDNTQKLFKI